MSPMAARNPAEAAAHDLFRLARNRAHCPVIRAVDGMAAPTLESGALRVFALLSTRDFELAFERLAQLVEQAGRGPGARGALYRWAHRSRGGRMKLDPMMEELELFYRSWDVPRFWRSVTRGVAGRELEFLAAVLAGGYSGQRLLIGIADALKLRGESASALQVYLAICRLNRSPQLLENVFAMAVAAQPGLVQWLITEFIPVALPEISSA